MASSASIVGYQTSEYSRADGSRWMISAVARIFRPGTKGRRQVTEEAWAAGGLVMLAEGQVHET
jgi:hypothetical protein